MLKKFPGILVMLALCSTLYAATWDEPWHRDVVAKADAFGLFEVVNASASRVTFKQIRHLAGVQTGAEVQVNGYYSRELMSSSAINGVSTAGSPLQFKGSGTRYYLFLKKAGTTWHIASPTSGFAEVRADTMVVGTFRISVHLALIDANTYELSQTCIFRKLHGEDCSADIYTYIRTQLSAAPPEGDSPEQMDRFFKQHVALETAYLSGYALDRETLSKFLPNANVHTQISAVRALRASNFPERNATLMAFVTDETRAPVARVMAVQMIKEAGLRELKEQIAAYLPKASSAEVGLGIAIMDPRIGTRFPDSVKAALQELLAEWK